MISPSDLSEAADALAAASLATLSAIMFFGRLDRVQRVLLRGRYEFGLIWGAASLLRLSQVLQAHLAVTMLHVATAVFVALTAWVALMRVVRWADAGRAILSNALWRSQVHDRADRCAAALAQGHW